MIEPIDEARKPKVSAEFQLVYFLLLLILVPHTLNQDFMTFLGIAYIFSSPSYACKRSKRNPLMLYSNS